MYTKDDVDLSKITLKTLLLYPPGSALHDYPPLSIPQLHAYLKSKNYTGLAVVDLNTVGMSKLKLWLQHYYIKNIRYSPVLDSILSIKLFNKTLRARFQEPMKHIVLSALKKFSRKGSSQRPSLETLTSSLNTMINSAVAGEHTQNKYSQYVSARIEEGNIQLIGFSVLYPMQLYYAILIARLIKVFHKHVFIVMGGPLITKHAQLLKNKKELCECVDGFIAGDGEEPLAELIHQLEYSRNFDKVPNLYVKKEREGYTQSNATFHADATYILEPIFDNVSSYAMLPIRMSYGCPWGRCTYCTYRYLHQKFSQGNVEHVVRMMKNLRQKYKISNFRIIDDFISPRVLREFSDALIKEHLNIRWRSWLALVPGLNESIIQSMARAGCKTVIIGLESMSPRILKLMDKPQTPEHAKRILECLKDAGIKVVVDVIFGFPTETIEEASITLDFLLNNKELYDAVVMQPFCLEEDTPIFNEPHKFGITQIYTEDKQSTGVRSRLGYQYEVRSGMSQQESRVFTEKAKEALKDRCVA